MTLGNHKINNNEIVTGGLVLNKEIKQVTVA
jgi:hypothetical protein